VWRFRGTPDQVCPPCSRQDTGLVRKGLAVAKKREITKVEKEWCREQGRGCVGVNKDTLYRHKNTPEQICHKCWKRLSRNGNPTATATATRRRMSSTRILLWTTGLPRWVHRVPCIMRRSNNRQVAINPRRSLCL